MKDKLTNMNTEEIINQFIIERNGSKNTKYAYMQSIRIFENHIQMKLPSILYLAEKEQNMNMNWKHQTIKKHLITFRKYLYDNYKKNSAKHHLSRVIAVFRHYEITIEKLPYFSTKQSNPSIPINPDLMVDREVLKLCINVKNPLLKALTLFMSSTGMSKADTLNLTIQDFLNATREYHETNIIHNALHILKDKTDVIGYWEDFQRQKTGQVYYTFNSHESTTAIVQYLLSREKLTPDAPLFDISYKYMGDLFKETNDRLMLGKNGQYSRFSAHMLRRYHATQLVEAGMSKEKIDILQGRKPSSIAYQSYIKIKPSKLKQEYIKALPYLVIDDINRVKTELESVKEENQQYKNELEEFRKDLNDLKKRSIIWEEMKQ
jgi:integrase